MFVNGDALARGLWLVVIAIVVLAGVLLAHLVWVGRIARSPALAGRPMPARLALTAAALATPVIGFYAVEIAALARRGADRPLIRRLAIATLLTLALAAAGALSVESHYVPEDRSWRHAGRIFWGQLRLLLIGQVLVFMILRVFAGARRPLLLWLAHGVVAAALVFLLV